MNDPTKPSTLPEWATDIIKDNISGQYNVYEPPVQKRKRGWDFQEKPPRQLANWLHKLTYEWLRYFDYFLNRPNAYTLATKPAASNDNIGLIIYISDLDNGTLAVSNGTNWKKLTMGGTI